MRVFQVLATVLALGAASCSFAGNGGSADPGDGARPAVIPDGSAPENGRDGSALLIDAGTSRVIPHLPLDRQAAGAAPIAWTGTVTIDTSAPKVTPPLPAGVTIDDEAQSPSGPELMVIRASAIDIAAGATVKVTGSRPLVLVATTITVEGTIDVGAHGAAAGPGGAAPQMGSASGKPGGASGGVGDSGGGGAGFGVAGAAGGAADTQGGCRDGRDAAGGGGGGASAPTELAVLEGASGGGTGSPGSCAAVPSGAGGGALQLSAITSITLAAGSTIASGGGGAGGGPVCGSSNAGAGGGGGAGGAIYLDALTIASAGTLAANGGAGGGGGCGSSAGGNGADGPASSLPASGGAGVGTCGHAGGAGAALTAAVIGTADPCGGNAGGGGGGVGVIVLHVPLTSTISGAGVTSPISSIDTSGSW